MHLFKRSIYLFYYISKTDWTKFRSFLNYSSVLTGRRRFSLIRDAVSSVFKYNIALIDYFYFRFYDKNELDRKKWAGTGFMYEFQLKMNPKEKRRLLSDKILFLKFFNQFVHRHFTDYYELVKEPVQAKKLLENPSGRLVLKNSKGQAGTQVKVISCAGLNYPDLLDLMIREKLNLAEEYVCQHPLLDELSLSGLNTVRIITQYTVGNVEIISARLRISVNAAIDNMAAGNLAAAVDIESGTVMSPAVFSDITKEDKVFHPITGKKILGFHVPYWAEVLALAREAAILTPENRSIGWDIAITPYGPELIEGNHNWCKLLWQLPVKKGLKAELEKYL